LPLAALSLAAHEAGVGERMQMLRHGLPRDRGARAQRVRSRSVPTRGGPLDS
jgi:hypothetical protein